MEKRWIWLALMVAALFAFTGCSDDDDPVVVVDKETMFEILAAAGEAYINDSSDCPGVKSVEQLDALSTDGFPEGFTVIDIRSEATYLAGHIEGAYNSSLQTLMDDLPFMPQDKPFVVVCYSGQSAGHAKIAMELLGYEDVYSFAWGMCGWSSETNDSWDSGTNTGNRLLAASVDTANVNLETHTFPVLDDMGYEAGTVVAERIRELLTRDDDDMGPFRRVSYDGIKDNLESYFIINYFGPDDYYGVNEASGVPGHIPGAYQFTPYQSLGMDQMLKNLPSDGTDIVVYCWTGQHSSQITFYLNFLGYDAYSLSFGSNALFYSELKENAWPGNDYPNVERDLYEYPQPLADYEELGDELADYFNSGENPGVIPAFTLYGNLTGGSDYTIIDLRSSEDFDTLGHIEGAIQCDLADLVGRLDSGDIPSNLPFIVTCYTGQNAGYAKAAMELLGYDNVQSLKWGMSSWNNTLTSRWDNAIAYATPAIPDNTTNENGNNNENLMWYSYPDLERNGDKSVEARVAAVLGDTGSLHGKSFDSIRGSLDDFFLVTYWDEYDYMGVSNPNAGDATRTSGHLAGSYQFTPRSSLAFEEMLAKLPSDGTGIVVYCWSGQTSAQITLYLRMLGYDAYSMTYGANNMFYNSIDTSKWSQAETHDYPVYNNAGELVAGVEPVK